MYSSHRIDSVTCLRLSSRWIVAQSGSARLTPVSLLRADQRVELRLQRRVGHLVGQGPAQAGRPKPIDRRPRRRRRNPNAASDLSRRHARKLQAQNFAHLAHRRPLCRHPVPPLEQPKERTLNRPAEAPSTRAKSSRIGGRDHLGTPGGIISEWVGDIIPERWAACPGISRTSGRLRL